MGHCRKSKCSKISLDPFELQQLVSSLATAGVPGTPGAPGLAAVGSTIPFGSGAVPVVLTVGVTATTGALVGFGSNDPTITLTDITAPAVPISASFIGANGFSYTAPTNETLTNLTFNFVPTAAFTVGASPVDINATIYTAAPGSNNFTATSLTADATIPAGTTFDPTAAILPPFTGSGSISVGSILQGTRVLLVITASSGSALVEGALTGTVSAGLALNP